MIYFLYSFFLLLYNTLPLTSYIQVFITSKFLFVFYYFGLKSKIYKYQFFKIFIRIFSILFILSIVINVLYFIVPNLYIRSNQDVRGINGITIGGIFFSRTVYSGYLVFCIILLLNIKQHVNKLFLFIYKYKLQITCLCLLFLLLTFTRKDILFGILIIVFFLSFKIKSKFRPFYQFGCIALIFIVPFLTDRLFGEINQQTFTEDQVRTQIFFSGLKVFNYYAPFGSGPGTFGSIMSIQYQNVYRELDIAERIYLGFDQAYGPIFDVFIISLLAEYGLGIIIIIAFFLTIQKAKFNYLSVTPFINVRMTKNLLLFYIAFASISVPILINGVGLFIIAILAILTNSKIRL
ncbi:O-antigen ligase family protein [Albibacterium sp.]|uniref:O-antigen ligase family protein n=1 Tax=Albibacterium sp. TaxID=2952885 RepID=UPI002CE6E575|nr:O-antigen ligase family protein [Albibacterium sp.]HUH18897.1 O-antigen ligase family protein [Albibacterium sp.]